ncbi:MAG: hypothetical protein ACI9NQ_001916 [Paracoccaceae bacterium]|jgi:hypothetical protein
MMKYSLTLGALLAAIGWAIAWPKNEQGQDVVGPSTVRVTHQVSRSPEQLSGLIDQLKDSTDSRRQSAAARDLEGVRRSEIHELLLGMVGEFGDVFNFPVAAKLLFVELARRDPAEAVAWSWRNLREARGWAHAFEQIGPQWAWDDPEGFSQFVKTHLRESSSRRDLTMEELLASSEPVLSDDETNDAQLWLMKSSPRLAFQLLRLSGSRMLRGEMIAALNSKAEFESALSTWDDYDQKEESKVREAYDAAFAEVDWQKRESEQRKILRGIEHELEKVRHPSRNSTVKAIVRRWKIINSEEFAESSFADWDQNK